MASHNGCPMGRYRYPAEHPVATHLRILCLRLPLPAQQHDQVLYQATGIKAQRRTRPGNACGTTVTPDNLESWVRNDWVDLRLANCARWVARF